MKKLVIALAVILGACSSIGFAEPIKLTAGTYIVGEGDVETGLYTITTQDVMTQAFLSNGTEINVTGEITLEAVDDLGFKMDIGEYVAGKDFPAGKYSIDLVNNDAAIWVYDEAGNEILYDLMFESRSDRIGTIEIMDGWSVKLDIGSVHFGPAIGITFD